MAARQTAGVVAATYQVDVEIGGSKDEIKNTHLVYTGELRWVITIYKFALQQTVVGRSGLLVCPFQVKKLSQSQQNEHGVELCRER